MGAPRRIDGNIAGTTENYTETASVYVSETAGVSDGQWLAFSLLDTTYGVGNSFKLGDVVDATEAQTWACVADETITAAGFCRVVIAGFKADVRTDGAVVRDDIVIASTPSGACGRAVSRDSSAVNVSTYRKLGYALETDGGSPTTADMIIFRHPYFPQ